MHNNDSLSNPLIINALFAAFSGQFTGDEMATVRNGVYAREYRATETKVIEMRREANCERDTSESLGHWTNAGALARKVGACDALVMLLRAMESNRVA